LNKATDNNRQLAIFGGEKTIKKDFASYRSIGDEEEKAAIEVIKSGVLSKFLGCWHDDFYGGPKVREFEKCAAEFFKVKYAITVNSLTSGLIAAVGAIGIEPGDEVIVTPWTMSATATAILHWNGIPVFADIDRDTYNLCPSSIQDRISHKTKAIIVADIFGQSADMDEIMSIAHKHNLKVISDTAQAPGAKYKSNHAGTCADIGGYSLNYHKHIHTGEGGILVTNDDNLAEKLYLIRNHGEVVVGDKGTKDISNILGYNFRLGEIECAMGITQLKKLNGIIKTRIQLAEQLKKGLEKLEGLTMPLVKANRDHVYYVFPMQVDLNHRGISKEKICKALNTEGVGVSAHYQNIHLLPLYQQKIAYGKKGFPWVKGICEREISYAKGICPIAESLNDKYYLGFPMCAYDLKQNEVNLIIEAFHKVWHNLDKLQESI
jgi:perosamine synthetase